MNQLNYNITKRSEKPRYIVIHTTGNPRKGANAEAHWKYWNGSQVGQSVDFVVDDTQALQINDYNQYYTWHCGDGKGKYGITNSNSIGIEICINEDGNFEKAVGNAVQLVKKLKAETGITQVVRHYDASRKNCPAEFSSNNWAMWYEFLARVDEPDRHSFDDTVNQAILDGVTSIANMQYWERHLGDGTEIMDNVRTLITRYQELLKKEKRK